ncbi:rhodanese domain-containing protein CG4456 [Drosophila mojavensis]|uniref:Rhodanese domain-containing protein n=1 Tax=Drosophila mojavensis TaxID=7230 RepID=B4L116_DROMO|nr:rhodanese domain-containing protein CG4456 [Drosophila mojavensis]EDW18173.2 uncharacterized protein Dmoj_GI12243 [Drosophila mojavensis]
MRLININIGAANAAAAVDAFVIVLTVASLLPIISANDSSNREFSDPSAIKPVESTISSAANLHIKRRKIMDATYEQVKDVPNHPEIYLIDVRNPEELTATGSIPSSLNVPLPELEAALNSDSEEFEKKYGRAKPANDANIIFTCRSGRRAQEAAEIAKTVGFTNLSVYRGSWLEWAEKEGLPQ